MNGFKEFDNDVEINVSTDPNGISYDKNEEIRLDEESNPKDKSKPINNDNSKLKKNMTEDSQINISNKNKKQINSEYDTLEESVCTSLTRDLIRIYNKLKHVLIPKFSASKKAELQNWDLWGPLIICLLFCL